MGWQIIPLRFLKAKLSEDKHKAFILDDDESQFWITLKFLKARFLEDKQTATWDDLGWVFHKNAHLIFSQLLRN